MTLQPARTADPSAAGEAETVIAGLRASFLDGLEQRIIDIECDWLRVKAAGGAAAQALARVENDVHRIAGIAGSLAFQDIGAAAAALDHELAAWRTGATSRSAVEMDRNVDAFLSLLEEALERV